MLPITYGFGNIGRDKKPGSTKRVDTDALEALREGLPDERAVAILVEINEGDDNNELAIVRHVFAGFRFFCTDAREIAAVSPDFEDAAAAVHWVPDSAVERWSPQRSINLLRLGDDEPSVLFGHYAAGAHGQGDRPDWAKPLLNTSWDNTREKHVMLQERIHSRRRDLVWIADVNAYQLPRLRGEQTVVHDRTDWIRVMPAPGRVANFKALPEVPFRNLDSHDGQRCRGGFRDAA